ncbi:hypothetical protein GCM10010361_25930 [Streptomyces olivaceiscleroticus]|uniref:Uncharacterized protein n=1 Tax=Streptomyces olivaceiscleroticus TaxID=68245 RepID=A0ABN0ZX63_9ACTN
MMDVTLPVSDPVSDPVPVPPPHPATASARAMVPDKRAAIRRAGGLAGEIMLVPLPRDAYCRDRRIRIPGMPSRCPNTSIFLSSACYMALHEDV